MTHPSDDSSSGGWQQRDLLPRPDPTKLTTEQLRRELDQATSEIRREMEAIRLLLFTRIENEAKRNDERHGTQADSITMRFREAETDQAASRREAETRIQFLRELLESRFGSVEQQFAERDVRISLAATRAQEALAAALQAAKELVAQQNEANVLAAAKAEQATTKQIDAIGTRFDTLTKAIDDRLTELKERIDRGEGTDAGLLGSKNRAAQVMIIVIATISVLVTIGSLIFAITKR